jgi:hypothetical protein
MTPNIVLRRTGVGIYHELSASWVEGILLDFNLASGFFMLAEIRACRHKQPNMPTSPPKPPKLEETFRRTAQLLHLSHRTEETYWAWCKRFIIFHGKRHPEDMGRMTSAESVASL